MSRHHLRFALSPGAGTVLWSAEASGDPVPDLEGPPLLPATRRRLEELAAWYDTSLDWRDPGGPSLWGSLDRDRFDRAAAALLEHVRGELGADFVVEGGPRPPAGLAPPEAPGGAVRVLDRSGIESFLRRRPALHLYELGDLDAAAWPDTAWYALRKEGFGAVVLGYHGIHPPCYLAMTDPEGRAEMEELVAVLGPALPERLYLHLSPGLERSLEPALELHPVGPHLRMALRDRGVLEAAEDPGAEPLGPRQHGELRELYAEAYPSGWFDPRFLARGRCFGVRREGRLASVAGVHVLSSEMRVAAVGNVATRPSWRGGGLARGVVARLGGTVLREDGVETLGLNVKADNEPAIRCYRRLGFEVEAEFAEFMAWRR